MQAATSYSSSSKNQAQYALDFTLLEQAESYNEPPPHIITKFREMGHDAAVCEINRLAKKGFFIPLAFAPILLSKFGDDRFGTTTEAERVFALVLKKHKIDPAHDTSETVNELFAELMWAYIKRKSPKKREARITTLSEQRVSAHTRTALCSFHLKTKAPEETLRLFREWPKDMKFVGATPRYVAYAMINLQHSFEERRQVFIDAATRFPELKSDPSFTADYIRLAMMVDSNAPTEAELSSIESFFSRNPQFSEQDQIVREVIRACFKTENLTKARLHFTPCLDKAWLSDKTFTTIVTEVAAHSLQEAVTIYANCVKPFKEVNQAKPCYVLDFHSRLINRHGTEETDPPNLRMVAVQLWHLYSEVQKLKAATFVTVTLITGKGKSRKLKNSVASFLKTTFFWNYKDKKPDSGTFKFSDTAKSLTQNKVFLPVFLTSKNPLDPLL